MIRRVLWAVVMACLASSAWGSPIGGFDQVVDIPGATEGALCRLKIPPGVYGALRRSQDADLVVLDGEGRPVPFLLLPGKPVPQGPPAPVELEAPIFELHDPEKLSGPSGSSDIHIKAQLKDRTIELHGEAPPAEAGVRRYVVDLSEVSPTGVSDRYRLRFALSGDVPAEARADVLTSANLRRWRRVLEDAPFIVENSDGSAAIALSDVPGRYLLLCVRGMGATTLRGVRCGYRVWGQAREDSSVELSGIVAEDRRSAEYDTVGVYPITRLHLLLQKPGRLKARCFSRPDADTPWRPVASSELFLARARGREDRRNGSISIRSCEDRFWRMEFDEPLQGDPPLLRVAWSSGTIFFRAAGPGPWRLAFGAEDPTVAAGARLTDVPEAEKAVKVSLANAAAWGAEGGTDAFIKFMNVEFDEFGDDDGAEEKGAASATPWRFSPWWCLLLLMPVAALLLRAALWRLRRASGRGRRH